MTQDEKREYLDLLGAATRSVVPEDAEFCVVLFGKDGQTDYVSTTRRLEMPAALRELADAMERDMAGKN